MTMMGSVRWMLLAAALATASSATAAEDPRVFADADQIAALLKTEGHEAKVSVDKAGDRMIESQHNDRNYRIFFYGCSEGIVAGPCTSVQFYIAFTRGKPFPADRIAEWNGNWRFGRAYLDSEKDPVIEMDLNLDAGGMSKALFLDTLDIWFEVLGNFDEFVFTDPDAKPESDAAKSKQD